MLRSRMRAGSEESWIFMKGNLRRILISINSYFRNRFITHSIHLTKFNPFLYGRFYRRIPYGGDALYAPSPVLKMVSNEFSTHTYATIEFLEQIKYLEHSEKGLRFGLLQKFQSKSLFLNIFKDFFKNELYTPFLPYFDTKHSICDKKKYFKGDPGSPKHLNCF